MLYYIEQTESMLKQIWSIRKIEEKHIEETKQILCKTFVCQDSIMKLMKYADSLKKPDFKKLLYISPLISSYVEDILIKSLKLSDNQWNKVLEIFNDIKYIITMGQVNTNLALKDLINFYYQLIPYKSSELYEIMKQINEQFKKIADQLNLKPYQFKPIYKFNDLFQQEDCNKYDDFNIGYGVIKESILEGLRRAAISLIRTGCNSINPHETRQVTVYSNVRPLNQYVGKFDFKFMVKIRITQDLYDFLKKLMNTWDILEMQKKQYLKSESLILMTNLQIFAYFEIINTIWDDLKEPTIEMRPLDLQSIINYTRMLNTRNQNIILESKSQHFMSYNYLEHLIEQEGIPYLSTQIIESINEEDYFKTEEIDTQSNQEQQNFIANSINDRINIVFAYPNTNEQDILGEIVKREIREVDNILIICQTPKINEILTELYNARGDEIKIDYVKKGNQITKESKNENQKFSHKFRGEFEKILDDLLIPNYKVLSHEVQQYSSKLFKLIIKQYAQMNKFSEEFCKSCQDFIITSWISEKKYKDFSIECKCVRDIKISNQQNKQNKIQNKQNKIWKQFAKKPYLIEDRKNKKLFKAQLQQHNTKYLEQFEWEVYQGEQYQEDQQQNQTNYTNNLRLMRMKERLKNLRGFAQEYYDYQDIYRGDFLHGIDVDKQKIKRLLSGEYFVWAFEPSDRNYIMAQIYQKRYLQNLTIFQYYYQKLSEAQQINRLNKEQENINTYKAKVLMDSLTNISRNLGLIDQLGEYTLIIYGANRFLQGHVHSYIREDKIKRIVFIGDQNQLDTNIFIENNIFGQYAIQSHFRILSELINFHQYNNLCLTVQTKATKGLYDICKLFYPNLIDRNDEQADIKGVIKPNQFIEHEYLEKINNKIQIIQNQGEADFIIQFARYLVLSGNDQSEICIIAFTQQQKFDIETQLMQYSLSKIQVGAPIYFDGLYKKIVIVSLVRSNHYKSIGVLRNYTKLISALTRSRKALFVFGNFQMILDGLKEVHLSDPSEFNKKSLDIFKSLIDHCQRQNILNHYLEIKYTYNSKQMVEKIEYWEKLQFITEQLQQVFRSPDFKG